MFFGCKSVSWRDFTIEELKSDYKKAEEYGKIENKYGSESVYGTRRKIIELLGEHSVNSDNI